MTGNLETLQEPPPLPGEVAAPLPVALAGWIDAESSSAIHGHAGQQLGSVELTGPSLDAAVSDTALGMDQLVAMVIHSNASVAGDQAMSDGSHLDWLVGDLFAMDLLGDDGSESAAPDGFGTDLPPEDVSLDPFPDLTSHLGDGHTASHGSLEVGHGCWG